MTVLPQHVSNPEKVEKLAWALLTLQAQLQASIKEFKVSHARCGSLAATHQQAWLHPCSSPVSSQERLMALSYAHTIQAELPASIKAVPVL